MSPCSPDQDSRRDACRKRCHNSERKVTLKSTASVIQKLFRRIATLFHNIFHDTYAIPDRIGNCACCVRSLLSC